ncbi:MAG: hypothetical protein IIU57_05960 [Oscillospiraceae bacterium]|nr:hypothetical protein [Oscillospiraceae bacterium]
MGDNNEIVPIKSRKPAKKQSKESKRTKEQRLATENCLRDIMVEVAQTKVMSDTQLKDRLNSYLLRCYENKQYPTVEEGFLSTGYTRRFLMDIAQGKARGKYFSPEAVDILNRFLDICAAFDAKMVMTGKAPMIGYIFRSKQHYGYSDKTEVQLSGNVTKMEEELNVDDIARRYQVETTFVDDKPASNT